MTKTESAAVREEAVHRPTMRVIDILEGLSTASHGLTLTDLAELTGFSRATILPILKTLKAKRYIVQQPETLRYYLGMAPLILTHCFCETNPQMRMVMAEMSVVSERCEAACHLGALEGQYIFYIAKVDLKHAVNEMSHAGRFLYASCTAMGKALLSQLSVSDIRTLYPDGLPRYTENSITDYSELMRQLKQAAKEGISHEFGECSPRHSCMAVPIESKGKAIAAVSISVNGSKITAEQFERYEKELRRAKERIEMIINSNPDFITFLSMEPT